MTVSAVLSGLFGTGGVGYALARTAMRLHPLPEVSGLHGCGPGEEACSAEVGSSAGQASIFDTHDTVELGAYQLAGLKDNPSSALSSPSPGLDIYT